MVAAPKHREMNSPDSQVLQIPFNQFLSMTNTGHIVLNELLSPANINLNLKSTTRDAVLEELVTQIPSLVNQPEAREKLLRALREREQLHSTGIGDGVALPHARNALVGLVDRPVIVFGRQSHGIPFGALDGAPSKLFFLLVAPGDATSGRAGAHQPFAARSKTAAGFAHRGNTAKGARVGSRGGNEVVKGGSVFRDA